MNLKQFWNLLKYGYFYAQIKSERPYLTVIIKDERVEKIPKGFHIPLFGITITRSKESK